MSAAHDGGPAFPCGDINQMNGHPDFPGMTLRDYFAAKALETKSWGIRPYNNTDEVAKDCYKMADSMLKARQ